MKSVPSGGSTITVIRSSVTGVAGFATIHHGCAPMMV
jgi:hypothetical protein